MQTVFSYAGADTSELTRTYGEIVRQEFYDGDLTFDPADKYEIVLQKALAQPMSLLKVVSRTGMSFRRTQTHVRANKSGVRVLWFVRKGSWKVVRSGTTCTVSPGEFAILDSNVPFHARAVADKDEGFEAVQAIVPAHLFFSHLPVAIECSTSMKTSTDGHDVISKLLELMFDDGDSCGSCVAEPLVSAFLEAVSECISRLAGPSVRRQRVVDKRLSDIENAIMNNLTDPELRYDEVALKCGISPRYLCYVLKANNTSFSQLLWSQRLPKAREWLISESFQNYPIHEIAFMAGFKSAAHFSRMFKSFYGCSPKEYRSLNRLPTELMAEAGHNLFMLEAA